MSRQEMLDQLLELKSQRLKLPDKDLKFESYLDETIRIVASDVSDSVASMALLHVIEQTQAYMDKKDEAKQRNRKYERIARNLWWIATIVEALMLGDMAYLYFFHRDIFDSLP